MKHGFRIVFQHAFGQMLEYGATVSCPDSEYMLTGNCRLGRRSNVKLKQPHKINPDVAQWRLDSMTLDFDGRSCPCIKWVAAAPTDDELEARREARERLENITRAQTPPPAPILAEEMMRIRDGRRIFQCERDREQERYIFRQQTLDGEVCFYGRYRGRMMRVNPDWVRPSDCVMNIPPGVNPADIRTPLPPEELPMQWRPVEGGFEPVNVPPHIYTRVPMADGTWRVQRIHEQPQERLDRQDAYALALMAYRSSRAEVSHAQAFAMLGGWLFCPGRFSRDASSFYEDSLSSDP